MKYTKELILSSVFAVTGAGQAMAADAIIVEPEPVEYVRICDAYGTGYFYIPGTETCININGYVRTTYTHISRKIEKGHDVDGDYSEVDGNIRAGDKLNESRWSYRGRLNFQVKNETEYGTLDSFLRLQGTGNGYSDANGIVDEAHLSFAGFRTGYGDEFWRRISNGGAGSPAIYDGYYDDSNSVYAEYTYEWSGFSFTGGVEQKRGSYSKNGLNGYGGIQYKNDLMQLAFTAVRDSDYSDNGYKASAIFNLDRWQLGGWYGWESNGRGRYVNGNLFGDPGTHVLDTAWGVQINGSVTENLSLYGLYSEVSGDNQHTSSEVDDNKFRYWTVGASWTPVHQLALIFEYNNERRKADLGTGAVYNDNRDNFAIRAIRSW